MSIKILFAVAFIVAAPKAWAQNAAQVPAPVPVSQWPAGVVERERLPSERSLDYDFSAVEVDDIERWLNWIGIELPVDASGQLSGWLWGQRGRSGWFNFSDYRVEGEITSPQLVLDRWVIDSATLRFGYIEGHWYVGRLRGTVRADDDGEAIGNVNLAAKIPTTQTERLETRGTIEQVNLAALLRAFDVDVELASGGGRLQLSGSVPMAQVNELVNWTANASLQLESVAMDELPVADLVARATLQRGQWLIRDGRLDWLAEPIFIAGEGRLQGDFPFQVTLQGNGISLPQLLIDFGQAELAEQFDGQVSLTSEATGTASLGLDELTAQVASERLSYLDQPFEQMNIGLRYIQDELSVLVNSAVVAEGRITGSSRWASPQHLANGLPSSVELNLQGVQLGQLSDRVVPWPVSGTANGQVALRSAIQDDKTSWQTSGNLAVDNLVGFQNSLGDSLVSWNKSLNSEELEATLVASDNSVQMRVLAKLSDDAQRELRHTRLDSYAAEGAIDNFSLSLPLETTGLERLPVRFTGTFSVTGDPTDLLRSGRAELQQLSATVAGRDVELRTAILQISPQEFRLQRFQVFDERARIAGAGIFRRDALGEHQLNLRLANVQLATYSQFVPAVPTLANLSGVAEVEARLVKAATDEELLTGWEGSFSAGLAALRYREQAIGDLQLRGTIDDLIAQANLTGRLLEGDVVIDTLLPLELLELQSEPTAEPNDPDVEASQIELSVDWRGVDLSRLTTFVTGLELEPAMKRSFAELGLETMAGTADLQARVERGDHLHADPWTGWDGELTSSIVGLHYQAMPIGDLTLLGRLNDSALDVELAGQLLDGAAAASMQLPFKPLRMDIGEADAVGQPEDRLDDALVPANAVDTEVSVEWIAVDIERLLRLLSALPFHDAAQKQLLEELSLGDFRGVADLEAKAGNSSKTYGSLDAWEGELKAKLRSLSYRTIEIGDFSLQADLTDALLRTQLAGAILDGQVAIGVRLPMGIFGELARDEEQRQTLENNDVLDAVQVDASWLKVDLARLTTLISELQIDKLAGASMDDLSLTTIKGMADVDLTFSRPASDASIWNGWAGNLVAKFTDVQYRSIPVGNLSMQSELTPEVFDAELHGQVLGAETRVTTYVPLEVLSRLMAADQAAASGTRSVAIEGVEPGVNSQLEFDVEILGVDLQRLMGLLEDPRRAQIYAGIATIQMEGRASSREDLQATANIDIPLLKQGNSTLARQIVGRFRYDEGLFQVSSLTGNVAGGTVDAQGNLPLALLSDQLASPVFDPRDQLRFNAQRVDLGELVAFLFPDYADEFSGLVSYRGDVRFDRHINVLGDFHASDALVYGLPVQRGHGDLRLKFESDGSFVLLSSSNLTGTAIGGNLSGNVRLRGGSRYGLDGWIRIGSGKLDQLSVALGFERIIGTGRFDAAVDLQSRDAVALSALTGAIQLEFESGDAQSVPLLSEIGRYVPLLQLASTDITGGTLHAIVGQGQLRIRDFILLGDSFWIVGQGRAGLGDGRLDIEAVLETGGGITQELSQTAVRQLAISVIPQAVILAELNNLISNRSIYFHIAGTTGSPIIQARAARTIGKALLQNIRRQLLAGPGLSALNNPN